MLDMQINPQDSLTNLSNDLALEARIIPAAALQL
jgi:hypothetical protein